MTAAAHRRKPVGPWRSAIEAALILSVGMGFGRFAFTAVFPYMVEDGVISVQQGSWAASMNYAGYLLGALLAVRMRARYAYKLCLWSVLGTALCLAVLALPVPVWGILLVRGVAGAVSALGFVAASLWLFEQRGHFTGAPVLYAGVGVGIALSAELLVLGASLGLHSSGMWLLLGAVAAVMGLIAAPGLVMNYTEPSTEASAAQAAIQPKLVAVLPMVIIYGLAGFGYIVTATYLPMLVHMALPDVHSAHVWAVFGLGAVPACFVWHRLHERLGTRGALQWNLALQALGVALPVLVQSASSYMLSALLVGGTFTGTVTIAMPAAQRLARHTGKNVLAIMTLMYSVGQIIGPMVAELLHTYSHSFSSALLAAALALVIALICSVKLYPPATS